MSTPNGKMARPRQALCHPWSWPLAPGFLSSSLAPYMQGHSRRGWGVGVLTAVLRSFPPDRAQICGFWPFSSWSRRSPPASSSLLRIHWLPEKAAAWTGVLPSKQRLEGVVEWVPTAWAGTTSGWHTLPFQKVTFSDEDSNTTICGAPGLQGGIISQFIDDESKGQIWDSYPDRGLVPNRVFFPSLPPWYWLPWHNLPVS